jgi:hypothetical protein
LVPGLLILTVLIVIWDVVLYIGNSSYLDWLWVTSYPFALFVLFRSTDLPDRIFYLRQSLVNQRILEVYDPIVSPEPSLARERVFDDLSLANDLLQDLKERVLPHTAVLTILFCVFSNYVIHQIGLYRVVPESATMSEAWNAYANHTLGHIYILLVSLRLGRMAAFSLLMWGHRLVRLSMPNAKGGKTIFRIRLNPQPGHPDGVCGLKNILDFWAFEAMLLVPPLIYTLAWLAISGSDFCSNDFWVLCSTEQTILRHTVRPDFVYFWLSLVLIVLQVLSLWWPILALRMHMGHAQHIVQDRLDEIVKKASELRFAVVNSDDAKERKISAERLTEVLEAYQDYRKIPLWPISRATLNNHIVQLWTVLVFFGIVSQEKKIWPIIEAFFASH